jgi:hypothetical protein
MSRFLDCLLNVDMTERILFDLDLTTSLLILTKFELLKIDIVAIHYPVI